MSLWNYLEADLPALLDYTKPVRTDDDGVPVFLPLPVPEPVDDCPVAGEDIVTAFPNGPARFSLAGKHFDGDPSCSIAFTCVYYRRNEWVRVHGAVAAINGLCNFEALRQKEERRMAKTRARRAAAAAREHEKFCQRQAVKASKKLEAAKKAARAAELRWRAMP